MLFFVGFLTVGTMFDVGVWYLVKGLKVFDEEIELEDIAKNQEEDKMWKIESTSFSCILI